MSLVRNQCAGLTAAYIVESARTAGGRRNGALSGWHPADMAGEILNALIDRSGVDPAAIEDVIMGCVSQAGEQSTALGRNAVLASKLPQGVPAVTIDRQCGSSQQALQFAAQAVMSGTQDLVIAAGVESMSRVPMYSAIDLFAKAGMGEGPWSSRIQRKYGVKEFSQFQGAQMIADKYKFTREDMDRFALESHRRAARAAKSGAFNAEIVPLQIAGNDNPEQHDQDEGIRYDASIEAIGSVRPLTDGGTITAANASQICDGASGLLIASEAAIKTHDLHPVARIAGMLVTAGDPVIMLEEPVFATKKALDRQGFKIPDMDLYEVNEAFASIPLAWLKALDADPDRLNVNGGAIALGHPLGATGTKLVTTLIHALHERGLRYGLQTMCEGGGMANVTIIEAI